MTTTIQRVFKDADRARMREFFHTHLSDSTAFELPDRRIDVELVIPSRLWIAEDKGGAISAAIFASNNPDDVIRWRRQGNNVAADVIADQMLMIHDLAVAPNARRAGLGQRLVRSAINDARGANASLVCLTYDERTPGLTDFYTNLGFEILDGGETLALEFTAIPETIIGFPQDNPAFRWALIILNSNRVRRHSN